MLTAPLIPPCAHTEWLRLTGTTEKRSTATPSSAARIVAIRPARPPPTMTILSVVGAIDCRYIRNAEIERTPITERTMNTTAETYIMRRCALGPIVNPQTIEKDQIPLARWKVAERMPAM